MRLRKLSEPLQIRFSSPTRKAIIKVAKQKGHYSQSAVVREIVEAHFAQGNGKKCSDGQLEVCRAD